jgi:hypothetical protein
MGFEEAGLFHEQLFAQQKIMKANLVKKKGIWFFIFLLKFGLVLITRW